MGIKVGYRYLNNTINYPLITEIEILNISPDGKYFQYKKWGDYERYWKELDGFTVLSCLGEIEKDQEDEYN